MLAERVIEWTKQWKEDGLREGRQEGLKEGLQQGEAPVLRHLLSRWFGALPGWVEEKLTQANPETLERWTERTPGDQDGRRSL